MDKYITIKNNDINYIFNIQISFNAWIKFEELHNQGRCSHHILKEMLEELRHDEHQIEIPDDCVLDFGLKVLTTQDITVKNKTEEELVYCLNNEYAKQIKFISKVFNEYTKQLSLYFSSITERSHFNMEKLSKSVNIVTHKLKEICYQFGDYSIDIDLSIKEYIDIVEDYEWVLYSISDLKYILKVDKDQSMSINEKKVLIDQYHMNKIKNEQITEIFKGLRCSQYLTKRRMILEEVEYAWHNKKYYLGVAAILLLIEGLLIDRWENKDNYSIKESINQLKVIKKNVFQQISCSIITNRVFSNFRSDSSISRNKILHSYDVTFGNRLTFTKLMLLLDSLIKWI